jgi:hypothetical protein
MMTENLFRWRTLRQVLTEDGTAFSTPLKGANFAESKSAYVWPGTRILVAAYGKGSAGDVCKVQFSGWKDGMDFGRGPGVPLWAGQLTLGAGSYNAALLTDTQWDSQPYLGVKTWNDGVGHNLSDSIVLADAGTHAFLLLTTLWCPWVMAEVIDLDGAGEATQIGFLWSPVSDEGT